MIFDPHTDQVNATVKYLVDKYSDTFATIEVTWDEIKDHHGNVLQALPKYTLVAKGYQSYTGK